jgi:hypothetical protein
MRATHENHTINNDVKRFTQVEVQKSPAECAKRDETDCCSAVD